MSLSPNMSDQRPVEQSQSNISLVSAFSKQYQPQSPYVQSHKDGNKLKSTQGFPT